MFRLKLPLPVLSDVEYTIMSNMMPGVKPEKVTVTGPALLDFMKPLDICSLPLGPGVGVFLASSVPFHDTPMPEATPVLVFKFAIVPGRPSALFQFCCGAMVPPVSPAVVAASRVPPLPRKLRATKAALAIGDSRAKNAKVLNVVFISFVFISVVFIGSVT